MSGPVRIKACAECGERFEVELLVPRPCPSCEARRCAEAGAAALEEYEARRREWQRDYEQSRSTYLCNDCGVRPVTGGAGICNPCRKRQGIPPYESGPHPDPYPKPRSVWAVPDGSFSRSR